MDWRLNRPGAWALGAALWCAAAPWVVLPASADAFELPKRLAWGGLGVWLAWGAWKRDGGGKAGFWAAWWWVMSWMAARSFLGAGWGRWAGPWMAWAMPVAMFGLGAACRWGPGERTLVARAVALSGLAQAALMLGQRFGFDPLWGAATEGLAYAPGRMVGTIGYQNQAAEFLGLAAVCALRGWRGRWRWWAGGALLGVLLATANRGAIAGAAAAAGAMALASRRGRGRGRVPSGTVALGAAGGFLLAVLAAVSIPETRARIAEVARPGRSAAVQSRLWMARAALAMWRGHPWAGAGGGAYGREYLDVLGALLPGQKEHAVLGAVVPAREAHCDILQYGAEYGVAGLALLAVLAALAARRAAGAEERDRRGAAGVAAFMGVASLVSFTWQTSLSGPLAGLLLGMWCGSGNGRGEGDGDGERTACKWARANASGLAAWAVCLLALACLENARSLRIPWVPPKGPSLAEAAVRLHEAGRLEEALAAFGEAVRDVPTPALLRNGGATLAALGRWEEAAAVYERWARCGMFHDEALWNLSVSLERAGRPAGAAAAESERCRLFPQRVDGVNLYRLAVLYLRAGEPGEALRIAIDYRRRCAALDPGRWTPEWDNLTGGAWAALGNPQRARGCFERALERAPGMENARRNLEALER